MQVKGEMAFRSSSLPLSQTLHRRKIEMSIGSFLVLLLSVILFHFRLASDPIIHGNRCKNSTSISDEEDPIERRYIVRFHVYKKAEELKNYLEQNLRSSKGWHWVDRNNPASAFPTDFALVSLHRSYVQLLLRELGRLTLVKDVFIESKYSRGLLFDAKKPGKIFTSMSFEEQKHITNTNFSSITWSRKLMIQGSQVTSLLGAETLWNKGYKGAEVKMAIFDTGIRGDHPHFRNIKERTNWTNEDTLNDNLGHGTFVAGVIAGEDSGCLGFAPDAEIYAFRVFTDAQVSYTSWFLDAFNYAIATDMDVLNLSIGGPDYLDLPFVEKVWELTANNIIMVSAIGNDGPLYGTLNNPADQSDVIGVGGIDYDDHIASFSSRGMSTWEIPHGYGRIKPDIVAYGREIMGSKISTGCKSLSGTSVASPVVAGVVCLLVSVLPKNRRKDIINPASMKQALVGGAAKLSGPNMFEQGAGRLNLLESYEILKNYYPHTSIFPSILDYTDCPYSWPFCRQPLYAGAMPVIFNATILNGLGVIGYVEKPPVWQPYDEVGNWLNVQFTYSDVIWPWTGFLALHMQIKEEGSQFAGLIEGNVTVNIRSPAGRGEKVPRRSTCTLQLKLRVTPTPPRSRRILWDQYHSIKYPPGYIPRDSLDVRNDILDWHGDHLHTNFHIMFNMLRDADYYVETLGSPLTCFDASQYGTLLMVDLEDEYYREEIDKLRTDVVDLGLGLVVFAEWYNVESMVKMRFFDDNTRSWWTPVTGGANIPAINELLQPFGIAFGDKILNGDFSIDGEQSHYASGADIVMFPEGGYLHSFPFHDSSESGATQNILQTTGMTKVESPILGLLDVGSGRIAVYGDSNCLDSSHMVTNCYWLLQKILDFTSKKIRDAVLFSGTVRQVHPLFKDESQLPRRRSDVKFSTYSAVVDKELICGKDSRTEVWGTKGYGFLVSARNRKLPGYPTADRRSLRVSNISDSNTDVEPRDMRQENGVESNPREDSGMDFFNLLNREEVGIRGVGAAQWFMPAFIGFTGFVLCLSLWHMRQHRRKRRRGSGRTMSA